MSSEYDDAVRNRLEHSVPAFQELLQAACDAVATNVDRWQFAVEIRELTSQGFSHTDLRYLIHEELVEHAFETRVGKSNQREFVMPRSLSLTKASCFVLTEEGVRLARYLGQEHSADERKYPKWDSENRELRVGAVLIKRFRCPAYNQETVLAAFEEEGWPPHIDDPLPPSPEKETKRRLLDAIKSLNRNQIRPAIRFRGDGKGEGVMWEFTFDLTKVG